MYTLEDVAREVIRVAELEPQRTNTMTTQSGIDDFSCHYIVDGKPGCIIGQALTNLNLIPDNFESHLSNDRGILDMFRVSLRKGKPTIYELFGLKPMNRWAVEIGKVVGFLQLVQNQADEGDTWIKSVVTGLELTIDHHE